MEIATFLTASAALLTSIITMVTIFEMRRQRIVSHLPIIKILRGYSKVEIDQQKNWQWNPETLFINNYGRGVALNVDVKWEVEIESIIDMLKKYDPYNSKNISQGNNFLELGNSAHAVDKQSKENFPAIPINTQPSNKLTIPSYLTAAFGMYITEAIINRPESSCSKIKIFELEEFPTVNIKVKYKDINEKEYVKNFTLLISTPSIEPGLENEKGSARVAFDVKEASV